MSKFGFNTAEVKLTLVSNVPDSPASSEPEIPFTVFHNLSCSAASSLSKRWPDVCEMLRKADIISHGKLSAPLLKMATFGDERNPSDDPDESKWSLRHTGNLLTITGIEADYDAGVMPMEEAITLLEKAGIKAVIYSSWGDGLIEPPKYLGGPRWRVVAPFSGELSPSLRSKMVARLNGALGGVLADESFTLAQGFFIGARPGGDYKCKVTFRDPSKGGYIDDLIALDNIAIFKQNHSLDDSPDERYGVKVKPGSVIVSPEVYADLKAALAVIPADIPYPEWFRIIQAMSRLSDKYQAKALAREWSTSSDNPEHTAQAFEDKWRSAMREDFLVSYTTVFYEAGQAQPGWNKNRSSTQAATTHPLSLANAVASGADKVTVLEYVFDRFMSTGVNIVAGAPGVGKTTLIVPLALATAHLCPHDHPLKPRVRRNVIIITESTVQVQRVVYSLSQWGCTGMKGHEFDARVKIISARRLDPKLVSEVASEYAEWTCPNLKVDGSVFEALPLVVFDTANAILELESENDNAEVGRAMAHIKQEFTAFPVVIVAHTSKALGRGESDGLSTRGASAWTGDAQGTYMVFKDGEGHDAPRVLKTDKVRFPTAFDEMIFELVSHKEQHPNVLGELEDEWFTHSVARPLARGERAQLKEDTKEQRATDEWTVLCDEMLDLVRTQPEHSRTYYEQLPKTRGGPKGSQERKERAMTSLINDGCIKIVMLDKPKGRADHYVRVDEEVINSVNKGRYEV
jgi:hypothetical protein